MCRICCSQRCSCKQPNASLPTCSTVVNVLQHTNRTACPTCLPRTEACKLQESMCCDTECHQSCQTECEMMGKVYSCHEACTTVCDCVSRLAVSHAFMVFTCFSFSVSAQQCSETCQDCWSVDSIFRSSLCCACTCSIGHSYSIMIDSYRDKKGTLFTTGATTSTWYTPLGRYRRGVGLTLLCSC